MSRPYIPPIAERASPERESDDLLEKHRRDTIEGKKVKAKRRREPSTDSSGLLLPDTDGGASSDFPDFGIDDSGSW